ncbi:MAG: PIN/TRAM domain-containing protein [Bacillaceae bacterium]|nr:PIN/TRAM domain-containing protein [Bacillaceae bacterium]
MLIRILQLFFIFVGGTLGFLFIPKLNFVFYAHEIPVWLISPYIGAVFGAVIFYVVTFKITYYIVRAMKRIEESIIQAPASDVLLGTIGLILGLTVAYLIGIPLNAIDIPVVSTVLPIFITVFLGYFGCQIGLKKRNELTNLLTITRNFGKDRKNEEDKVTKKSGLKLKILDTSVIMDGRIADVCQVGFLEGRLVIPKFVLEEIQYIADSSDPLKRNRGRRGLDILNKIQKELRIRVEINEDDFPDIQEIDSKLVKLAKSISGVIVTNDFNFKKVCELQGVKVLNIDELAKSVIPFVLPGEKLKVQVLKDGKERHQGIAYLDDGTMIVIDGGYKHIGEYIDVIVTKALQTSAGRMIFAKPNLL